mmetsp:Transcript_6894/g.13754  ORF Transcript_6894/g.13754 Transcript_6894/m.13754 type:complete len:499 (-) Transcript_6894:157-1653(-)|eukprot:CAMPEP_0171513274 /NCGR_PEP_ID=MMETSP0959-20130129/2124_1 /TAXON_ID=87120 /ORGANISM="Aurantiochytrium limacinum, Strain ATCCMYA-1381" /LENGTH=498 /DNA_ID=CAMNT_0012051323 /DNA_START=191 /DNA_END=1687 /DNA_ORIENTATION=+
MLVNLGVEGLGGIGHEGHRNGANEAEFDVDDRRPLRTRGSSQFSDENEGGSCCPVTICGICLWGRKYNIPDSSHVGWRSHASAYRRLEEGGSENNKKGTNRRFSDVYDLKEELGKGSTARCFACVQKSTQSAFAVKVINKRKVTMLYSDLLPQFRREVDILRRLDHPHIIKLQDMFESSTHLHVVTELARGGELFDYLISRPNSTLTEAKVAFLMRQLISAVAYMHAHNVIHRDLKLENILLQEKVKHYSEIRLKIIDFGLSKTLATAANSVDRAPDIASPLSTRTFFGTMGYIAPEMMRRKAYTRSIDVWALGIVTFVLLCGVFPFDDKRQRRRTDYKLRYPSWEKNLSSSAKDLLSGLLNIDPNKRLTAADALKHSWVDGETASPAKVVHSPRHLRELKPLPSLTTTLNSSTQFTNSNKKAGCRKSVTGSKPALVGSNQLVPPPPAIGSIGVSNNEQVSSFPTHQGILDTEDVEAGAGSSGDDSSSSSSLGSPSLR